MLATVVVDRLKALHRQLAESSDDGSNKRGAVVDGKFNSAHFGSIKSFFEGLSGLIDDPHPNLRDAIKREHTLPANPHAETTFKASNYEVETTPLKEYELVFRNGPRMAKVKEGLEQRSGCEAGWREPMDVDKFTKDTAGMVQLMKSLCGLDHVTEDDVKQLHLLPEEVGCARMYTGESRICDDDVRVSHSQ